MLMIEENEDFKGLSIQEFLIVTNACFENDEFPNKGIELIPVNNHHPVLEDEDFFEKRFKLKLNDEVMSNLNIILK